MVGSDPLRQGWDALACGDWALAEKVFDEAVQEAPGPEAIDGLGRARWWRNDLRSAVELRTRAYRELKSAGRADEAAMLAVWLARELRARFGNDAAADGWLARARTLIGDSESKVSGWIALARAEAASDPRDGLLLCASALDAARRHADADLELVALARQGVIRISLGDVDEGTASLDEAMAGAGSGEATDLQSVGTAYCALMEAADLLGDRERFTQWTAALTSTGSGQGFGPLDEGLGAASGRGGLSVFCGSCCGGLYLVTGRVDEAERELLDAVADLESTGMTSRCVHPVTQLAEVRVLQGRFEEARSLLEPYADLPEAVRPLAVLELSLGFPEAAAARLSTRLEQTRQLEVAALPLQTVLVDAQLALGRLDDAAGTAATVERVAERTGSRRHRGEALFATGKVAASRRDPEAPGRLRDAARAFGEASLPLQACRARMALARSLVEANRPLAVTEARSALVAFDRLGAVPDADGAAAFLRELGVRGRTGPKQPETLSRREVEVLRLVAQGLSNPEIAARLFISTKTAGHHVSNILAKLGLRSRTEAAAYAAVHPLPEPAAG